MMWPQFETQFQTMAQIVIGRLLNSLPEGVLIAGFAWLMLRLLPRQNAGTRFAVWFVALLAVAGLPVAGVHFIRGVAGAHAVSPAGNWGRSLITVPGPWGTFLFLFWILAACAAMLRLTAGLWRLQRLRRSCIPIDPMELDPSTQMRVAEFSSSFSSTVYSSFSFSRSVILATSDNVSVPSALGFFAPMIVIPSWALRELSPEELNVILLHELAHLRRWDDWTNLLQKVVRAVLVFHPAVWWIESRLSLEREMACDDAVLAETANPRGYAKCLVDLLEKSFARRGWAMAQAAVHRASEVSLRLARILDVNRTRTRHVWKPALGLVGAFSLVCLMVVPRAPRLVAFESSKPVISSDNLQAVAPNPADLASASVIPASLRTRPTPVIEKPSRQVARQVSAQGNEHHPGENVATDSAANSEANPGADAYDAPQVIAARARADTEQSPADILPVAADQSPLKPTLLVVRTAQRVGQNSWVWSVTVWRVTWTNPAQDAARAPLAKKT
jgi:beta-lactamase regulating signal transducer with metallopeptidase domain